MGVNLPTSPPDFSAPHSWTVGEKPNVARPEPSTNTMTYKVEHVYRKKRLIATETVSYDQINPNTMHRKNKAALKTSTFFNSEYFRTLLKQNPTTSMKDLLPAYYSSGLINFRRHLFESVKNGSSVQKLVLRLGVITDHMNGWTNLNEIKELATNSDYLTIKTNQLLKTKERLLAKKQDKYTQRKIESIDFAIDQLSANNIQNTLKKRKEFLSRQFLELLQQQLASNIEQFPEKLSDGILIMSHLSLLNEKSVKLDKTGWQHNEANEMQDMHEIFNEFQGKEIVFKKDCKAPYFNAETNQIEMPEMGCKLDKLKLTTSFLNISVQGHTKNNGIQKRINLEGIANLRKALSEKWMASLQTGNLALNDESHKISKLVEELASLEKRLKEGESSYSLATAFTMFLVDFTALSDGCLSAKDRTGMVVEGAVRKWLDSSIETIFSKNNRLRVELVKRYFRTKLLDKGQIISHIANENGHKFIKFTTLFQSVVPLSTRINYVPRQIRGSVLKPKPTDVST